MGDLADRPDRSSLRTFWTTLPGILTGVAALITAIAGMVALFPRGDRRESSDLPSERQPAVEAPVVSSGESNPSATPSQGGPSDGTLRADPCFAAFFANLPEGRRKEIRDGAQNVTLIASTETKQGPIGLRLVSRNEVVGGLELSFTTQGEFFTIDRVVDSRCAGVESYANASRGGDKNVLQNWDEVRVSVGGSTYLIRFGYAGSELSVGHFRRTVE